MGIKPSPFLIPLKAQIAMRTGLPDPLPDLVGLQYRNHRYLFAVDVKNSAGA
jgi:hypothetical protein